MADSGREGFQSVWIPDDLYELLTEAQRNPPDELETAQDERRPLTCARSLSLVLTEDGCLQFLCAGRCLGDKVCTLVRVVQGNHVRLSCRCIRA